MATYAVHEITTTSVEVTIPLPACAADLAKAMTGMRQALADRGVDTSTDDVFWLRADDEAIVLHRDLGRSFTAV